MDNLVNKIFSEIFGDADAFISNFAKVLEDESQKEVNKEDENVKSYGYYDKKIYKDNKLVDHVEKKFEDGKCVKDLHEPCRLGISCSSPVLGNGGCSKHSCCGEKTCENKVDHLTSIIENLKRENDKLKRENRELAETNIRLNSKLLKIKNIF